MKKIMLAAVAVLTLTACSHYAQEGQASGHIIDFWKGGIFCKTWEGHFLFDGSTDLMVSFSVIDESLIPKFQEKLKTGEKVTVHYRVDNVPNVCTHSSKNIFTAVE